MSVALKACVGIGLVSLILFAVSNFSKYENHLILGAAEDCVCIQAGLYSPQSASSCTPIYQQLAHCKPVIVRIDDNTARVDFYGDGGIKTQARVIRDKNGDWTQY